MMYSKWYRMGGKIIIFEYLLKMYCTSMAMKWPWKLLSSCIIFIEPNESLMKHWNGNAFHCLAAQKWLTTYVSAGVWYYWHARKILNEIEIYCNAKIIYIGVMHCKECCDFVSPPSTTMKISGTIWTTRTWISLPKIIFQLSRGTITMMVHNKNTNWNCIEQIKCM